MNMKIGWRTAALVLSSLAMTVSFSACGSSDQSNPPLVPSTEAGAVELISSSLQYNETRTLITGAITTQYTDALTAPATLSNMTFSIPGCSISTASNDVVTYNDNSEVTTPVTIGLSAECLATALTINATETSDLNATLAWSRSASIADPIPGAVTSPIAYIVPDTATQNIELTQNNEPREIVLKVYDINGVPLSEGTISIKYPSEGVTGIETGSMSPVDKVSVVDGVAKFTYVGPSDLISLIDGGYLNAVWTFFDTLNPVKSVDVTITYNPDTTVPPPVLTGYTVDFVSSNLAATTNLETSSVFNLSVKDDKGNLIPNEDLNSTDITSLQPNLVKFIDSTGTEVNTLHFDGKNNIAMTIKTYTTSGLAPFAIALKIKDANGVLVDKNVTKAITVFSGPPTAMSISYAGTEQDEVHAKFIEKMVVSLTDKWNNPVNTQPTIYAGAIVGYATDSTSTTGNQYMIRESAVATVGSDGADGALMTDTSGADLSAIDIYNDVLMTFGNGYTYQASGKWDIASVAGTEITMTDKYTSVDPTANMGYAVGRNIRQDVCTFGQEWIGQVDSGDGTYQVDETGSAIIDFRYDYVLTGKTVVFGASVIGTLNSTAEELRMGEAIRHTLRGHGYDGSISCSVSPGATGALCGLTVHLKDTGYNAHNVNFGFVSTGSDSIVITDVNTSMIGPDGIYTCNNGGAAYVTLTVDNIDATKAGTIGINIIEDAIWNEF